MTCSATPVGAGRWAIVPVKRSSLSKQRLSPALGAMREAFARDLSMHSIEVIRASTHFDIVLVVTTDPLIRTACTGAGVVALDDHDLPLNDACALGLSVAAAHGAELASIIHSDLATLDARTLGSILAQFYEGRAKDGRDSIGLVRCKEGSGTNILLLDPKTPFTPCFGLDSFAAHVRQAGTRARELAGGEAAFDIDTPDDLPRLLHAAPASDWITRYASLIKPLALSR